MEILKKKIGVDLDDVLLNFNDALHAYHNAKYGTSVKRTDITSYEFHLISSRGDQIRELTEKWLHSNFPGNFASINLTNQYFGLPEKLCLTMVEDSLSQAKDVAQTCETVYLLDCPWNQGALPANVVRVYSWSDIANALA